MRQLSKLASFVERILPEACHHPIVVENISSGFHTAVPLVDTVLITSYRELIGTFCEHLVTCLRELTNSKIDTSAFDLDSIQRGVNFCIFADFDVERYLRAVLKWTGRNPRPLLNRFLSHPTLGEQLVMATLRAMAETPFHWYGTSYKTDFLELLKVYHRYKASEDIWNDLKAAVKEAKTLFVLKSMTESARKSFEKECTKEVSSWCMDYANAKCKTMEAFLKSSERTILVKGQFRGIAEARLFRIEGNGFSVDYKATGIGKSAQVLVTKSRLIFDSKNVALQDSKMVLDFLECLDCQK